MTKGGKKKVKSADSKDKNRNNMQPGTVTITPPTSTQHTSQAKMAAPITGQSSSLLSEARDVLYGDQQQKGTITNVAVTAPQLSTPVSVYEHNTQNGQASHNGQNWCGPMQLPGQLNLPIYHASSIDSQNMSLGSDNINYSQPGMPVYVNKLHSVSNSDQCKQSVYTSDSVKQNAQEALPWVVTIFKSVESRLQGIETQLSHQNSNWQQIEQQLQSQNTQLQNQNTRMTQIEQKVEQINEIKQKISKVETRVFNMDTEIDDAKSKISTCNDSIEYFNEMFDDIVTENKSTKFTIDDVAKRLTNLEIEHETIKSSQLTVEGTVLDLQCRSMRENLLFTGIDEAEAENSAEPSENSEDVLRTFFFEEMNIRDEIELDRVHRLGKWKRDQLYPRPIIAKFHRFKDRERVRLAAPKVLRGTAFGVREQFPPEIEAVRRTLYPVAKKSAGK